MKIEIFTLCDYARSEPTGKLYVIGTFDHMFSHTEPIQYPLFAIAARIRFERIEQGSKTVTLAFVDADGAKIMPDINAQLLVQVPPDESTATLNFVVVIPQISLRQFGEYGVDLAVDGRQEGSIPLYIRRAPPPQQVPGPRLG